MVYLIINRTTNVIVATTIDASNYDPNMEDLVAIDEPMDIAGPLVWVGDGSTRLATADEIANTPEFN